MELIGEWVLVNYNVMNYPGEITSIFVDKLSIQQPVGPTSGLHCLTNLRITSQRCDYENWWAMSVCFFKT
ncbi:hypothetical protein PR048_011544 [Dryococelus australis]|uniref:Uncharacterized protein n=1 Tax=Dryococelus australis TaxID=614101 RepID=A0ABQ9HLX6_9NEOP|nr:hypothetical protein PR048_011544 [Dryococelus australis]